MQYVLALIALSLGLVHSWDIVTTTDNRIDFYTGEFIRDSIDGIGHPYNITALVYDAVHNILLFVDTQSEHASIYSFNVSTHKAKSLLTKDSIEDIAYDPVKHILFWTDPKMRSIYWTSYIPGSKVAVDGNLLLKMDDGIPMAITVDSCRGFIYWTNVNSTKPTIERARFDGSEREVVVKGSYKPISLALDQLTKKIFWAYDEEGRYSIKRADFNGSNEERLLGGTYVRPKALTVSKDYMYLAADKYIWHDTKYVSSQNNLVKIAQPDKLPYGIAANYKIEDQTQGIPECEPLRSMLQHNIETDKNDSPSIPAYLFCVNGTTVDGQTVCNCTPGYIGERCDVSVCQNYCFQGYCDITTEGQPNCSCSTGYSGERCEVNVCSGYCLNNGVCSLNEQDKPDCECNGNYEGSRCEVAKVNNNSITPAPLSVVKNVTLLDLVSNHRKVAGRFAITFEIESP